MDFDHGIDRDNVKILKSESHAYRRRVIESFLINQKACLSNVINRNHGANFSAVYSVFVSNKYCLMYFTTRFTCAHSCICNVTMFSLLRDCLPCW